jgi:hypothetical protein
MTTRATTVAILSLLLSAGCSGPPASGRPGSAGRAGSGGAAGASGGPGGASAAAGGGSVGSAGRAGSGGAGGASGAGGTGPAGPPWQWTVTCPDGHEPKTPVDYGRCAVAQALAVARLTIPISIATVDDPEAADAATELGALLDHRPESYVIAAVGGTTWVLGRDDVGAMYGALEIAERLQLGGAVPPTGTLRGAPAIALRAANLFWTLPDPDDNETAWWFLDEGFWRNYLDLLAHARMDLLDLHGMYDLRSTVFPNALLQLARSASFPDVGVPPADRDRNLAMLNRVIDLCRARGIRVGLMTYQASSSVDGVAKEALQDADLKKYLKEAAADVATRAPGLALLGFRIGESGRLATWYIDSFVAGVAQAATGTTIYTRTWVTSKPEILTLGAAAGPNMLIEAKLNGEHLGPPYAIAGGAMTGWSSYSYQGYLTPPAPWQFVFQIRAGGTHQIFRQVSYDRTRRMMSALGFSPAVRGFTLEPPHAYTPQRDFYHLNADDRLSPWTFARDDLMYLMWGRLGYDPNTPEAVFRQTAAAEAGTDSLWPALQAASDIVPWIKTVHTCGPDSRSFEPELELGGDLGQWGRPFVTNVLASCDNPTPFDSFAVASVADAAADLVAGQDTSRVSPIDVAAILLDDAERAESSLMAADAVAVRENVLARDLARETLALVDLGRYAGHKLRAATALAVYASTGRDDWMTAARAESNAAADAWRSLAGHTGYIQPFHERLRMLPLGYDPFHWADEVPALSADGAALDAAAAAVAANPPSFSGTLPDPRVWLASPRPTGPGLGDIVISPAVASAASWTVTARFAAPVPIDATVQILWKPFDSEKDWSAADASPTGDGGYAATIAGGGAGGLFAVEVRDAAGAWRYPDPRETMPYVSLPP